MKVLIIKDKSCFGVYYRKADTGIDSQAYLAADFYYGRTPKALAKKASDEYAKKLKNFFSQEAIDN